MRSGPRRLTSRVEDDEAPRSGGATHRYTSQLTLAQCQQAGTGIEFRVRSCTGEPSSSSGAGTGYGVWPVGQAWDRMDTIVEQRYRTTDPIESGGRSSMPGDRQVDRATRDSRRSGMAQFWTAGTALQGNLRTGLVLHARDGRTATAGAVERSEDLGSLHRMWKKGRCP